MANQTRQSGQRRRKTAILGSRDPRHGRQHDDRQRTQTLRLPNLHHRRNPSAPNRQAPRPARMADRENLRRRRPRQTPTRHRRRAPNHQQPIPRPKPRGSDLQRQPHHPLADQQTLRRRNPPRRRLPDHPTHQHAGTARLATRNPSRANHPRQPATPKPTPRRHAPPTPP